MIKKKSPVGTRKKHISKLSLKFIGIVILAAVVSASLFGFLFFNRYRMTSSVLVSQSLGANSPETARMATYKCLKFCICLAVFVSALLYFCKYFFVGLYTSDLDVIKVSTYLIGFASIYHVFDAVNCVGSFSMRGYRITFLPMIIYGVFLWGLGLGLGSILTFTDYLSPAPMGAAGYWTAITIGLTLSGIIVGLCAVYVARAFAHGHKVWLR